MMDPQEETRRQAEEALKESERITLGIVEGGIPRREGSVDDVFDKAKAEAMRAAGLPLPGDDAVATVREEVEIERQKRAAMLAAQMQGAENLGKVAAYRIPAPVSLSDLRERLELCRRSGVTHYEDQVLKITFSPTANRSHDGLSPMVEKKTW